MPYGEETTIQFEDDYFTRTIPGIVTKSRYSVIEKVVIGNDCVYLFINSVKAILIPISAFESNEQRESFQVFIQEKIGLARRQ